MTTDVRQAKQPVSAALAGPYGHPFHPILGTVPIGAWVSSLAFDYQARRTVTAGAGGPGAAHSLFAVATVVLVLLSALGT